MHPARDWQQIKQQVALKLAGTAEGDQALADAKKFGALADEIDSLRDCLKNLWLAAPTDVECRNMHHPKSAQHRYDESCNLVTEYHEAIVAAQQLLKEIG